MDKDELDTTLGKAVEVTEDGITFYSPAQPAELTLDQKLAALTKDQRDEIATTSKTVSDFYVRREETEVSGMDALRDCDALIQRYDSKIDQSKDARRILAVQAIAGDEDVLEVLDAMTNVNYHTLETWCAPKKDGKAIHQFVDKKIVSGFEKAVKDRRAAEKARG